MTKPQFKKIRAGYSVVEYAGKVSIESPIVNYNSIEIVLLSKDFNENVLEQFYDYCENTEVKKL